MGKKLPKPLKPIKLNPAVKGNLQMSVIFISSGSIMFLSKKGMLKDGSFFLMLIQSGTMLHFPRHFSSSRQTLENQFICFKRAYVGVVFDAKISAGNHYVFAEELLKNAQNSTFLEMPSGWQDLEDWLRVTEFPAVAIKTL